MRTPAAHPVLEHELVELDVACSSEEVDDRLVLLQQFQALWVVLFCLDRVSDVGAFEVVEGEDQRVQVGEFGDAFPVCVRVREADFLLKAEECGAASKRRGGSVWPARLPRRRWRQLYLV